MTLSSLLLTFIDERFEAMMLRPGMWVGALPEHTSSLELLVLQLLEIRHLVLTESATSKTDVVLTRKYMGLVRKRFPKVGARFGITGMLTKEAEIISFLRECWAELTKPPIPNLPVDVQTAPNLIEITATVLFVEPNGKLSIHVEVGYEKLPDTFISVWAPESLLPRLPQGTHFQGKLTFRAGTYALVSSEDIPELP